MVTIATTSRLTLREMTVLDAPFIHALLNQPTFLRFIGDRQVRSDDDAAVFIDSRYRQSYRDHGYGLWVVEATDAATPIGICGFVRRDALPAADIGFAFLPEFEGRGYAYEAAAATLLHGHALLGLTQVLAIATEDNTRSHRLLIRLGFQRSGAITMPGETDAVALFELDMTDGPPRNTNCDDTTGQPTS